MKKILKNETVQGFIGIVILVATIVGGFAVHGLITARYSQPDVVKQYTTPKIDSRETCRVSVDEEAVSIICLLEE